MARHIGHVGGDLGRERRAAQVGVDDRTGGVHHAAQVRQGGQGHAGRALGQKALAGPARPAGADAGALLVEQPAYRRKCHFAGHTLPGLRHRRVGKHVVDAGQAPQGGRDRLGVRRRRSFGIVRLAHGPSFFRSDP